MKDFWKKQSEKKISPISMGNLEENRKLLKKKTLDEKHILFINTLISYSITLKIFFFLNFLIFIPILLKNFLIFLKPKLIIFPIILLSLNLYKNYKISGCYYYPIETTCILNAEWKIDKKILFEDKISVVEWTKSWSTYIEKKYNREEYIQNFNWFPNWFDNHYKNKIFHHHIVLFIISIFYFITFKKKIKKKEILLKSYKKYTSLIIA